MARDRAFARVVIAAIECARFGDTGTRQLALATIIRIAGHCALNGGIYKDVTAAVIAAAGDLAAPFKLFAFDDLAATLIASAVDGRGICVLNLHSWATALPVAPHLAAFGVAVKACFNI